MITHGSQNLTADGVVGISAKPIMLYSLHIRSGAGGAGTVILYSGTSTSGTELARYTGTINDGRDFTLPAKGRYFPNGLNAAIHTNVTYVPFDYVVI